MRPSLLRWVAAANVLLSPLASAAAAAVGASTSTVVAWASEQELLASLAAESAAGGDGAAALSDAEELPLLQTCVARSWWAAARALVARAHVRQAGGAGAPLRAGAEKLLAGVKQSADEFAAYADSIYRGQTQGVKDEVHCALQWAQNSTTVFLGIKYATRWSAPGAIEVVDVKVNTSECCFNLEGYGHHSNIRKRYSVNLDLFEDILPDTSSWSSSSVGRLIAMLQKKEPGVKWPRLTKSKSKSKHQITTWLDMEDRWADELGRNSGAAKKKEKPRSKEKDQAKDKGKEDAKVNKDKVAKGQRVMTPWRKELSRFWKNVRLGVQDPRKLEIAAVVASLVLLSPLIGWLILRGSSGGAEKHADGKFAGAGVRLGGGSSAEGAGGAVPGEDADGTGEWVHVGSAGDAGLGGGGA